MYTRSFFARLAVLVFLVPGCSAEVLLQPDSALHVPQHEVSGAMLWEDHGESSTHQSMELIELEDLALVELLPSRPDVFLLQLDAGVDAQLLADSIGAEVLRVLPSGMVVFSGIHSPESQLDALLGVASYEPNQFVDLAVGQDLTLGFYEGHEFTFGDLEQNSKMLADLALDDVHLFATGAGVTIGVVDTGVDPDHPLLEGRVGPPLANGEVLWKEYANGIDDDGDGEIDEAFGHGTFVAGMIAQVAPHAEILSVRALEADGVGSLADVLTAIEVLKANRVHIINLSLSLSSESVLFEQLLEQVVAEGILVVAAAGNQGGATAYPAKHPDVIGVAALDELGAIAAFSNRGPDCELAGPGVGVHSAYPGGLLAVGDGTSFAAPIVAGAIALVLTSSERFGSNSLHPLVDPTAVSALLMQAQPILPLIHGKLATAWLAGVDQGW